MEVLREGHVVKYLFKLPPPFSHPFLPSFLRARSVQPGATRGDEICCPVLCWWAFHYRSIVLPLLYVSVCVCVFFSVSFLPPPHITPHVSCVIVSIFRSSSVLFGRDFMFSKVLDARKLPFEAGSFDLVVDKGTVDAMLCDGSGIGNARQAIRRR